MIEIKIPIEKIAADKAASKALIQECVESGKAPEDAFLDIFKRRGLPQARKSNPQPRSPWHECYKLSQRKTSRSGRSYPSQ